MSTWIIGTHIDSKDYDILYKKIVWFMTLFMTPGP